METEPIQCVVSDETNNKTSNPNCPTCGRKIPDWAYQRLFEGVTLRCTICGCRFDIDGIKGFK